MSTSPNATKAPGPIGTDSSPLTASPDTETIAGLHPNHFRELTQGSGLSVETIRGNGIFSEHDYDRLASTLNRKRYARKLGAALVFPYFDEAGTQVNVSVKPNNPSKDSRGRLRKYLLPSDSQPRLYVPIGARAAVEEPGVRLLITEGEKKALKSTQEGFAAVSIAGVEGWHRKKSVGLIADLQRIGWKGREVFVAFDSDAVEKEGVKSNEELLASVLANYGAEVKVVRLPAGPGGEKVGLDDFLVQNGAEAFNRLLSEAEEPTKPAPDDEKTPASELDPAWEAKTILESSKHDGLRRIIYWRGSTYLWKDGAYRELEDAEVRAKTIQHLNRGYFKLSSGVVNNVLDQLKAQSLFPFSTDPPTWIGRAHNGWNPREVMSTRSGLVHLPSLVSGVDYFLPPTPRFFTPIALDYAFDATSPRPETWLQFLDQLWGDDSESIDALQEWFGLSLVADTSFQKILLVIGPKRSGKGTIARVQRQLVGPANVCGPTLASLGTNFGLWPLVGKTLAVVSDARLGGRTDASVVVERLLSISGEDALTVDRKNLVPVTGKLETRIMILSNELPRLGDSSGALAGRMVVLQLRNSFYGKEDRGLFNKLIPELPGILNWAILGWQRLNERGYFVQPASADSLRGDLHDLTSPISEFLSDHCELGPAFHVSRSDLYGAYVKWCDDAGRRHIEDSRGFGRALRAAVSNIGDCQRSVMGRKVRFYEGVGLREDWS